MGLTSLEITHFRNLDSVKLRLDPYFNVFRGVNGSGKTSLLEALYLLGRGVSFRSRSLEQVVNRHHQRFVLFGRMDPDDTPISVEYDKGETHFRLNGLALPNRLALTTRLPLLFTSSDNHLLLTEGPQQRRRLLDWGTFHVEPGFLAAWHRYHRVLKQRNSALRMRVAETAWDRDLTHCAEQVTFFRQEYLRQLQPYFQEYVLTLVNVQGFSVHYACGWRHGAAYPAVLDDALEQDRVYGHTRYGPHRADLVIKAGHGLARDAVSRGQQKLIVYALLLAQAALFVEKTGANCMVLADDVAAELDDTHRERLIHLLTHLGLQVCVTTTDASPVLSAWLPQNGTLFHVEQGQVSLS